MLTGTIMIQKKTQANKQTTKKKTTGDNVNMIEIVVKLTLKKVLIL